MNSFSVDKGVTTRSPSTANLMLASYDRDGLFTTSGNFQISKNQALANGIFTRIGVTEVVFDWRVNNVVDNSGFVIDVSGVGLLSKSIPVGCYGGATALDTIVSVYNASPAPGTSLAVTSTGTIVTLTMTGGSFRFPIAGNITKIVPNLGFTLGGAYATTKTANISLGAYNSLQPARLLDIVSPQLTYCQDVKDGSTDANPRDVLVRWYMATTDVPQTYDKYGFPELMGMRPFQSRRLFNPPKQIKWDNNFPIGTLGFQVYDQDGDLFENGGFEWSMTLQLTEN